MTYEEAVESLRERGMRGEVNLDKLLERIADDAMMPELPRLIGWRFLTLEEARLARGRHEPGTEEHPREAPPSYEHSVCVRAEFQTDAPLPEGPGWSVPSDGRIRLEAWVPFDLQVAS